MRGTITMTEDLGQLLKALPPEDLPNVDDRWYRIGRRARRRRMKVIAATAGAFVFTLATVVIAAVVLGNQGPDGHVASSTSGHTIVSWIDAPARVSATPSIATPATP